ncbi:hypothetical protein CSUI_000372, partial [Cystoisospora suis]
MNGWPGRVSSGPSPGIRTRRATRNLLGSAASRGDGASGQLRGCSAAKQGASRDGVLPSNANVSATSCKERSSSVVKHSDCMTRETFFVLPRETRRARKATPALCGGFPSAAPFRGVRSSKGQACSSTAGSSASSFGRSAVMSPTVISVRGYLRQPFSACWKQTASVSQKRRLGVLPSARMSLASRCGALGTSFHVSSCFRPSRHCCSSSSASPSSSLCFFPAPSRQSPSCASAQAGHSPVLTSLPSSPKFFFSSLRTMAASSSPSDSSSPASPISSDSNSITTFFRSPRKPDALPANVLTEAELLHLIRTVKDREGYPLKSRKSSLRPCGDTSSALPRSAPSLTIPRSQSHEIFPPFFFPSVSFHLQHSPHILFSVLHLYSSSPSLPASPLLTTLHSVLHTQPELIRTFSAKELSICMHALARLLRNLPGDKSHQRSSSSPPPTRMPLHSPRSFAKTERPVWRGHSESWVASSSPPAVTADGDGARGDATQGELLSKQNADACPVEQVDSWAGSFQAFEDSFVAQLAAQFSHSYQHLNRTVKVRCSCSSLRCCSPVASPSPSLAPPFRSSLSSVSTPRCELPSGDPSPPVDDWSCFVPGPRLKRLKEYETFFAARDQSGSPQFSEQRGTTDAALRDETDVPGFCAVSAHPGVRGNARRRESREQNVTLTLDEVVLPPPHLVVPQDLSMFLSSLLALRRIPSPSLLFAGCCYIRLYLPHIPPHGLTLIAYNISRSVSSAFSSDPSPPSPLSFPCSRAHRRDSVCPSSSTASGTAFYSLLLEPRLGPFSAPVEGALAFTSALYDARGSASNQPRSVGASPPTVSAPRLPGTASSAAPLVGCPCVASAPGSLSPSFPDPTLFQSSTKDTHHFALGVYRGSSSSSPEKAEDQKAHQSLERVFLSRCSALQLLTSALEVGMLQKARDLQPADWCCGLQALHHLLNLQFPQVQRKDHRRMLRNSSAADLHSQPAALTYDQRGGTSSARVEEQALQFPGGMASHASGRPQPPSSRWVAESGAGRETKNEQGEHAEAVTSQASALVELVARIQGRGCGYLPTMQDVPSLSACSRVEADWDSGHACRDSTRPAALASSFLDTCASVPGILGVLACLLDHLCVQLEVFATCSLPQIALALTRVHKAVLACFRIPGLFVGGRGQEVFDLASPVLYSGYSSADPDCDRNCPGTVQTAGDSRNLESTCRSRVARCISVSSEEAGKRHRDDGAASFDGSRLTKLFASLYVQACREGKERQSAISSLPPSSKVILLSSVVEGLCLVRSASSSFPFLPSLPGAFCAFPATPCSFSTMLTSSSSLFSSPDACGRNRGENCTQHPAPSAVSPSEGGSTEQPGLDSPTAVSLLTIESAALSLFSSLAPSLLAEDRGSPILNGDSISEHNDSVSLHREDGHSRRRVSTSDRYRLAWDPKPQDLIDLLSAATTLLCCLQEHSAPRPPVPRETQLVLEHVLSACCTYLLDSVALPYRDLPGRLPCSAPVSHDTSSRRARTSGNLSPRDMSTAALLLARCRFMPPPLYAAFAKYLGELARSPQTHLRFLTGTDFCWFLQALVHLRDPDDIMGERPLQRKEQHQSKGERGQKEREPVRGTKRADALVTGVVGRDVDTTAVQQVPEECVKARLDNERQVPTEVLVSGMSAPEGGECRTQDHRQDQAAVRLTVHLLDGVLPKVIKSFDYRSLSSFGVWLGNNFQKLQILDQAAAPAAHLSKPRPRPASRLPLSPSVSPRTASPFLGASSDCWKLLWPGENASSSHVRRPCFTNSLSVSSFVAESSQQHQPVPVLPLTGMRGQLERAADVLLAEVAKRCLLSSASSSNGEFKAGWTLHSPCGPPSSPCPSFASPQPIATVESTPCSPSTSLFADTKSYTALLCCLAKLPHELLLSTTAPGTSKRVSRGKQDGEGRSQEKKRKKGSDTDETPNSCSFPVWAQMLHALLDPRQVFRVLSSASDVEFADFLWACRHLPLLPPSVSPSQAAVFQVSSMGYRLGQERETSVASSYPASATPSDWCSHLSPSGSLQSPPTTHSHSAGARFFGLPLLRQRIVGIALEVLTGPGPPSPGSSSASPCPPSFSSFSSTHSSSDCTVSFFPMSAHASCQLPNLPPRLDRMRHTPQILSRIFYYLAVLGVNSADTLRLFYPALLSSFAFSLPARQSSVVRCGSSSHLFPSAGSAPLASAEGIIPAEQLKPVALVISTLRAFPNTDRLCREQKVALCRASLSSLALNTRACSSATFLRPLPRSLLPPPAQGDVIWRGGPTRSSAHSYVHSHETRRASLEFTPSPGFQQQRHLSVPGPTLPRSVVDYAHMVEAALVGAAELRVNEPGGVIEALAVSLARVLQFEYVDSGSMSFGRQTDLALPSAAV